MSSSKQATIATATSSLSQKFNPRANVFLLVNLGCEMLYVIDQRLKAQQIAEDKSNQVIHDITAVLLEPKFIDSLILGSAHSSAQILTTEHCKFMLKDIATCSLMRLDDTSMDKLWDLMTVIYKWQLFLSKHQHHLLDITIRHLNAVGKLYPDEKRGLLIDFTKNTLLDFWNSLNDDEQLSIYVTNKNWLQCFNTKISLLIRLGFQALDGSFISDVDESYFEEFASTVGENVYIKSAEIAAQRRQEISKSTTKHVDQLAELLNFQQTSINDDLKPIDACLFQKQYEEQLQRCNILFDDLDVNSDKKTNTNTNPVSITDMKIFPANSNKRNDQEFVHLNPVHNRKLDSSGATANATESGLRKDLLDLYSKMK